MSKFNTETTKYEKAKTTHGIQKNASYSVQSTPSGGCTPSALFVASDREDPTGHRSRPKTLVHVFCPETEELMRQQEDVPTTNKHFCICPHFLWDIVLLILCSPAPFFFFPPKNNKRGPIVSADLLWDEFSLQALPDSSLFIFCISVIRLLKGKDCLEKR